ncbi:DUF4440 domain-containing protein [Erythrobacter aureus]|uniref:DUF4440 domain-containing protein n=1 Tax=Erythrobacter aureus TaxID=2182384 RepID=A0A345YB29_9SPHN|nr:DUF4440 domain-containing protein [Erythrobacter aureus]AXK41131.1 DUF4440 domain-containing protein [Erythrobacter aureus]
MLPSLVAALLLAQAPAAAVPAPQPMPTGDALEKRIVANDARLFWGFFEGCDPDAVSDLIHPDFRMLHDLVGMPLSSGAQMIEQSRRNCADRAPGGKNEGYRNRRLPVPGSRRIQKLGDWGVPEEGHHTFHEWRASHEGGRGGWEMTGGGRYIHSWQWMPEEGRFRLLESLSIDHGPAVPYPPQTAARP